MPDTPPPSSITLTAEAFGRMQQLAALGEVAAGVVHETRNLMTVIIGFAQLARRKGDQGGGRYCEMIETESLRVSELLDHFLRLARVDESERAAADVAAVIRQATGALEPQLVLNRIALAVDVARGLPAAAMRTGELHQVMLNLLVNAMHATPARGEIRVTASATESHVEIVVADTGPGVPPALRERIFEPFFSTKSAGQGTGLGLALCRRVLEAAGGRITCDDGHPHGARFVVRIPVKQS